MGKSKNQSLTLVKNTGILAIGSLCSKAFQFFLLPLYTSMLSTEDYGVVDVWQTVAMFALPLVTLQLCAAIFRFIIEKKMIEDQQVVVSTAILAELIILIISFIIFYAINSLLRMKYGFAFAVYFILSVGVQNILIIARGLGKNGLYSLLNFIMTMITVVLNIIFIVVLKMSGGAVLVASSIAYFMVLLIGIFALKLWKYVNIKAFSVPMLKKMLDYCIPLIPSELSWWITNTSDRLIILLFLGASANGIYASANKISAIYITVFHSFSLAWTESLSRNVEYDNQIQFINNVFNRCFLIFGCINLAIISASSLSFKYIIGSEYADSYFHILILLIAVFFNSLASLYGGVFTAYKCSRLIGTTTVTGAIVNFIVNIVFIRFLGLYAASISTLISYSVILLVRSLKCKHIIDVKIKKKNIIILLSLSLITIYGYLSKNMILNILTMCILIVVPCFLNRDIVIRILNTLFKKIIIGNCETR